MIKFDGYYIYEPVLYQERKDWEAQYFFKAYLFLENGKMIISTKLIGEKNRPVFSLEDFQNDNSIHCYFISNNEMYYVYKCEKNGYKFYHDIISEKEIKYRDSGDIMEFIPWKEK
jgi:hypothetical protein